MVVQTTEVCSASGDSTEAWPSGLEEIERFTVFVLYVY